MSDLVFVARRHHSGSVAVPAVAVTSYGVGTDFWWNVAPPVLHHWQQLYCQAVTVAVRLPVKWGVFLSGKRKLTKVWWRDVVAFLFELNVWLHVCTSHLKMEEMDDFFLNPATCSWYPLSTQKQGCLFFTVHKAVFRQCIKMHEIICQILSLPWFKFCFKRCYGLKHRTDKVIFPLRTHV